MVYSFQRAIKLFPVTRQTSEERTLKVGLKIKELTSNIGGMAQDGSTRQNTRYIEEAVCTLETASIVFGRDVRYPVEDFSQPRTACFRDKMSCMCFF